MGASVYKLRIEIDGKPIPMPLDPFGNEMLYHDKNPAHNPWSYDGRYAFFHEFGQSMRMPDDSYRLIGQRTWCIDTHTHPNPKMSKPRYWFNPQHSGRWSPNDYRVVSSDDKQITIGHPLTEYRATWRRFFVHHDTRDWWDMQNYGWLDSGRVVWSAYRIGKETTAVRFDDASTGQCILNYHLEPDHVIGREAALKDQANQPSTDLCTKQGLDPTPTKAPGYDHVQRIHCMLGTRNLWLEIVEADA